MIIHECKQGSPEWRMLRCGIPTASNFDRILTPSGARSKGATNYAYELVAEWLLGQPIDSPNTAMMDRGHELESEAVAFAEFHLGLDSEPVGFMTNDERTIGASPDRLIGDHALLEIKCPGSVAIHMGHLVDGTVLKAHRVQAQGQLWIAEREKAYVVSYYPGLPNAIGETDRDEAFIALLKEAVEEFVTEMEKIKSNLAERGIIPAVAVAAVEDEEMDFPWLKESK